MSQARAAHGRSFGRKAVASLVQAACYAVVLSCGTTNAADRNNEITGPGNTPVLTAIIASLNPSTITVGQSVTAGAALLNQSGFPIDSGTAVTWSSTVPAVATVSSAGVVTGIAAGSTQLIAAAGGVHGQIIVRVIVPPPVLTTMTVMLAQSTLPASVTTNATATGLDQNGAAISTGTVIWTTSNPAVASITNLGAITGLSVGTSQITAIAGAVQASATVTVTAIPVAFVTVTAAVGTVAIGLTNQFTAKMTDVNGTVLVGRPIAWSTSDATEPPCSPSTAA